MGDSVSDKFKKFLSPVTEATVPDEIDQADQLDKQQKPEPKEVKNLKIVLVTSSHHGEAKQPTIEELEKVCKKKGIETYTLFSNKAFMDKHEDGRIFVRNHDDKKGFEVERENTVFLTRRGIVMTKYALNLVSRIEKEKFFVFNTREAVEVCEDKYLTMLRLAEHDVPIPKTALIPNEDMLDDAIVKIGGKFPVVVKILSGTQGRGVFIADNYASLKSTLQTIWTLGEHNEVLLQEYIDNDFDVRVHVLGGEFLASMKRKRVKEDFRTNVHLGGEAVPFSPNKKTKEIACKAAKAVGAGWAGVDVMFDKKGNPYVLEVNASPGTEGIKVDKGANVPVDVIDFLMNTENWSVTSTEIGVHEMIRLDSLGEVIARFDTGNQSDSVSLDAQDINIDEKAKTVTWKTNGFEMKGPYIGWVRMKSNSSIEKESTPERPLTKIDLEFLGVKYKDVKVNLNDRSHKTTKLLMNTKFMVRAGLTISPGRDFLVTLEPKEKK